MEKNHTKPGAPAVPLATLETMTAMASFAKVRSFYGFQNYFDFCFKFKFVLAPSGSACKDAQSNCAGFKSMASEGCKPAGGDMCDKNGQKKKYFHFFKEKCSKTCGLCNFK